MDITTALKVVGKPSYVEGQRQDKYAFDSREATYLSAVAALTKQASQDIVAEVDAYAKFWNIEGDVRQAREKWASATAPVDPDEQDYALSVEHNGQRIQKFAAYSAESTIKAARAFHENKHKLPYAWRKTASVNLLARAQRFGAPLPDYLQHSLEKSAGYGVPTADGLQQLLSERFSLANRHNDANLDKLAEGIYALINNEEARYDLENVKIASEMIEAYDKEAGIASHYADGSLSLPEEAIDNFTVLSVLEKAAAADIEPVELVNGFQVDPKTLDKTALSVLDPALAEMSAVSLSEVLPTLPRGDADLLQRLVG